jgi:hypothetical protein
MGWKLCRGEQVRAAFAREMANRFEATRKCLAGFAILPSDRGGFNHAMRLAE